MSKPNDPMPVRRKAPVPDSVLIVEDDPDQAELTRLQIARSGRNYRMVLAGTMQQAMYEIQGAQQHPFKLIFLDRGLPDISSDKAFDDALTRIRNMAPDSYVIINSGNNNPAIPQMAEAHGMRFMHKDAIASSGLMREVERIQAELRNERMIAAQKSAQREEFFRDLARQDARHDTQLANLNTALTEQISRVSATHNDAIAQLTSKFSALVQRIDALEGWQKEVQGQATERVAKINAVSAVAVVAIPLLISLSAPVLGKIANKWLHLEDAPKPVPTASPATKK